ncbi:MAG: hypothetical protein KGY99_06045 [Phycisphaerae bacterium]|nr:hypothetical protein [Phycisphaerae bacterium]
MDTHRHRRSRRTALLLAAACAVAPLTGCGAPPATTELLAVARQGLAGAQQAESDHHAAALERIAARRAALDAAFDADVARVASGELTDAAGAPVALTAEWVISARKGYAAARDALAEQARAAEQAHATRADNLAAADEALAMAQELIVRQWALRDRVQKTVLTLYRSIRYDQ